MSSIPSIHEQSDCVKKYGTIHEFLVPDGSPDANSYVNSSTEVNGITCYIKVLYGPVLCVD